MSGTRLCRFRGDRRRVEHGHRPYVLEHEGHLSLPGHLDRILDDLLDAAGWSVHADYGRPREAPTIPAAIAEIATASTTTQTATVP